MGLSRIDNNGRLFCEVNILPIKENKNLLSNFISFSPIFFVLICFISMIIFPQQVFKASLRGLQAWWNVVFPALFPFFVISELLMSFGIVHSLGILLEPLMRPLFNVPGSGAIVMAFGYTSGAPIGSIITARLRKEGILSREEAERLFSFTNNASPLFMLGAIAVGMLNNPALGITIAGSHYLANLSLGIILLRHWGRKSQGTLSVFSQKHIFKNAYAELIKAHNKQNKPLGKLLSDAIKNSINTLLLIGGFIILFSTIIELLQLYGFLDYIAYLISFILSFLDLELSRAIASGIIEMTIGSKIVSETAANLNLKVAAISFILGWAGVSIHAQVLAMINDTDIRFLPFLVTRILHGPLAALISLTIFNPVSNVFKNWHPLPPAEISMGFYLYTFLIFSIIILILTIISLAIHYLKKICNYLL
ncbi:MAG: hypothetical protein PWQ96_2379 [Clostridia bacterium]|nr:hypothetical protein [Clostridia bacterium]